MNVKKEAINDAAELLLNDRVWNDIKMFVQEVEDTSLTNEQKKAKVAANMKIIFGDTLDIILNVAIELGVAWLKSK